MSGLHPYLQWALLVGRVVTGCMSLCAVRMHTMSIASLSCRLFRFCGSTFVGPTTVSFISLFLLLVICLRSVVPVYEPGTEQGP
jgi:hypothetical protein